MVMSTSLLSWTNVNGDPEMIDYANLQYINDVLKHTLWLGFSTSFTNGYLDLIATRNIYLHS